MSTEYTGSVTGMKSTKWLGAEDFIERGDVEMTITGIYKETEEVMQDGKKKDFFSVSFDKTDKKLVLNATNRQTLAFAFGAATAGWTGRKITLYAQDGVKAIGGGKTMGIRIKVDPANRLPLPPPVLPFAKPQTTTTP